jgi:signal transduction histidine kinase
MAPLDSAQSETCAHKAHSRGILLFAFIVIGFAFVAADAVVLYRSYEIRTRMQVIVEDMLASVRLVSRMGLDVSRERRLLELHILATNVDEMSRIEAQMAECEADFGEAAAAYEPLVTQPGERSAWERLQADVLGLKAPVAKALNLSRINRDTEAGKALRAADERFSNASTDVDSLIGINREGAEREVQQLDALQRFAAYFYTILVLIGIAVTSAVGYWAVRMVSQREKQLARYSLILEGRNRDLDAFAGRVAHDLRGPLTTIGLAAMKLSQPSGEHEAAVILQRGLKRMDALIGDLLELSRAGVPPAGTCDPAAIVGRVHEDLAARLQDAGAAMHIEVAPAKVHCNEGLLRQCLWNLVDNALKYSRSDAPAYIDITGRLAVKGYDLRVSDNGIGMSAEEARQAFDPFYRAARSRELPGTGLGLSIVKRVIETSGGTISAQSQSGRGTTFIINLVVASGRDSRRAA